MVIILIKLTLVVAFFFAVYIFGLRQKIRGIYVYLKHNQSKEQLETDEGICYLWAQQQVGGAVQDREKEALVGSPDGAYVVQSKAKEERGQEDGVYDFKRAYSSCLREKGYSVDL